jgi:hypothetical protein
LSQKRKAAEITENATFLRQNQRRSTGAALAVAGQRNRERAQFRSQEAKTNAKL